MNNVLVFPDAAATSVAKVLHVLGATAVSVDGPDALERARPSEGWHGAILGLDDRSADSVAIARWLREQDDGTAILFLIAADELPELGAHSELFDDFCLAPFHPAELEARLEHLLLRGDDKEEAIITYGPLSLNVETYQAVIDGRPLDLTYMEYELLRYLASQPGKVFSREVLLSEVWGYDYYGGARTVDVHIRRLRSKMGEEHANLISTVRSVGYRLGQARWS